MKTLEKDPTTSFQLKLWKGPFPLTWIAPLQSILISMYQESNIAPHMSLQGFTTHTMEQIIAATNGNGEFWICTDGINLLGYLLGGINKDINNEPTYVVRQAWVSPSIRRQPIVKGMLNSILLNAKSNFCKHVVIAAARSEKAYLRWLGKGWNRYITLLRGEL